MKNRIIAFVLVALACAISVNAQEFIPLNTWRVHLSYNEVVDLDKINTRIVAGAKEGIFFYDIQDGNITTLTSLDGIHPSEISAIGYDEDNELLFIGHTSGVIDIVNKKIIQLDELQNDFRSAKRVNEFYFHDDKAFISTDIGLLIYSISRKLFTATYDGLGSSGDDIVVNDAIVFDNKIFAATEEGVIAGSLAASNLNDFRQWERFQNLPAGAATSITILGDEIYAAIEEEGLYKYDGSQWQFTGLFQNEIIKSLSTENNRFIVTTDEAIYEVAGDQVSVLLSENLVDPDYAFADGNNNLWIADNGLVQVNDNQREVFQPSGPQVSNINKLEVLDQKLYALQGQLQNSGMGIFSVFDKGIWYNYSPDASSDAFKIPSGIDGFYDIALFKDALYVSTFGDGLLKIGQGGTELITSPFFSVNGSVFLTGLAVAGDGLWIGNFYSSEALYQFNGQSFQSFNILSSFVTDITVAPNKYLLLIIDPAHGGGFLVFDPSTGNQRLIDDTNGLPSSHINDVVFDIEGRLWVATSSGVAYFSDAQVLFNPDIKAVVPVFENRFLLRNVNVTSVAIDGGGRKWFGSHEGAWLFDNDITEQIYYFNENNSPLLSNTVQDIILLQSTGEVFFATAAGLISFRSDASNPALPLADVKVFPNPVTPDFTGTVGITGIAGNANVKITDVNGNLVYETTANGSTASWNLHSNTGQKVASGIYLIFTAKEDGSEVLVGKIAVVR